MPDYLSLRERIERAVLAIIDGITGIGTVERWSMLGQSGDNLSAVVYLDDTVASNAAQGSTATTTVTIPCRIELLLAHGRNESQPSSQIANAWEAKIKSAMLADTELTEADTGEQLAVDVTWTGTSAPIPIENQPQFFVVVNFAIIADEYRSNPYTAPGITAQEEGS